ncbi:SHOCT domain-containing protein [Gulosibacter sp. 10]|uniref:SHOCT domain-containing protein n=1 Tax=Gulosibacter sp. 10 TaxID=1255570 RepID=UPI00097F0B3A|nr:SPFH domain-containing protein [Gulosibacter sp. 10]SJM69925.1 conserved hypothetical protein [Gulosibacter sp. 10]
MGFIQAFSGAIGGMFADQWIDFLEPPRNLPPTAAIFPAVANGQNAGRGSNTRGSEHVITSGSKILVPEGFGLITMEDGGITGFIAQPGGFVFEPQSQDSKSVFTGGGFLSSTVGTSWERFKHGGRPGSQQMAFYVNLKEIPNNRFGTQSEIYWDDAYLGTQVGAITRGTYTLRIVDPILFVRNFVPQAYTSASPKVFDFGDIDNPAGAQLFNEVVSSLAPAFSNYTNDPNKGNRMSRIQGDALGFAQSLSAAVEEGYQWSSDRGLVIVKTAIQAIEYDETTKKLLADAQKADALSGARGQSFLQQSVARGFESAGENSGGQGIAMMGMGMNAAGGAMNFQQNPNQPAPYQNPFQQQQQQGGQQPPQQQGQQQPAQGQQAPQQQAPQGQQGQPQQNGDDSIAKLAQYKQMLDQGLITQEDYDAAKNRALGLG